MQQIFVEMIVLGGLAALGSRRNGPPFKSKGRQPRPPLVAGRGVQTFAQQAMRSVSCHAALAVAVVTCCSATFAMADGSVDFNGSTSKAEHTTADMRNSSTALTYCCWVRADGFGEGNLGAAIVVPEIPTNDIVLRHRNVADTMQLAARWSGGQAFWDFPVGADGTWHAVAIAYDFGNTTNDPTARVDFAPVTVTQLGSNPTGSISPTTGYCIGNNTNGNGTWDGRIAYAQIFNRILSAEEMDKALRSPGAVTSGLRLFLKLRNSTDLSDYSGLGHGASGTDLATGADGPGVYVPSKLHAYRALRQ